MPLVFLLFGALILVTAIRNTYSQFAQQLTSDLTGSHGFIVWIAIVALIGMVGYIPKFETPSRAFLGLIVVAYILANGGLFDKFNQAILQGGTAPAAQPETPLVGAAPFKLEGGASPAALNVKISGLGGGSGGIGGIASAASSIGGLLG